MRSSQLVSELLRSAQNPPSEESTTSVYNQIIMKRIMDNPHYKGSIESNEIPSLNENEYIIRYSQNKREFFYCYYSCTQRKIFQMPLTDALQQVSFDINTQSLSYNEKNTYHLSNSLTNEYINILRIILTDLFTGYPRHYKPSSSRSNSANVMSFTLQLNTVNTAAAHADLFKFSMTPSHLKIELTNPSLHVVFDDLLHHLQDLSDNDPALNSLTVKSFPFNSTDLSPIGHILETINERLKTVIYYNDIIELTPYKYGLTLQHIQGIIDHFSALGLESQINMELKGISDTINERKMLMEHFETLMREKVYGRPIDRFNQTQYHPTTPVVQLLREICVLKYLCYEPNKNKLSLQERICPTYKAYFSVSTRNEDFYRSFNQLFQLIDPTFEVICHSRAGITFENPAMVKKLFETVFLRYKTIESKPGNPLNTAAAAATPASVIPQRDDIAVSSSQASGSSAFFVTSNVENKSHLTASSSTPMKRV